MSSNTLAFRMPRRADADARRMPVEPRQTDRSQDPDRRAALAGVAEDVSPSIRGAFRLFVW